MNYSCSFVLAIGDNNPSKLIDLAQGLVVNKFKFKLDQDIEFEGHVIDDESISIVMNDLDEIWRLLSFLRDIKWQG